MNCSVGDTGRHFASGRAKRKAKAEKEFERYLNGISTSQEKFYA